MKITVDSFGGIAPALSASLLSGNMGQTARNCRLEDGALRAFRAPLSKALLDGEGTVRTIHPYEHGVWLSFLEAVQCIPHPTHGDEKNRIMIFGNGKPCLTDTNLAFSGNGPYPAKTEPLGVPAPTTAPAVILGGAPGGGYHEPRNIAYCYTFVNARSEESAPSPPSEILVAVSGQTVTLSGLEPAPAGWPVAAMRIYRTFQGASGDSAEFHLVEEVALGVTEYVDTVPDMSLAESLPSKGWYEPPEDLHGVVTHPAGFLVGCSGAEICFTPPYLPFAWPKGWRITMADPLVGLGVVDQSIVALTSTYPVLVTGNDPEAMAPHVRPSPQACVSARGIVSLKNGVVYPSPDGLCMVANGEVLLLTRAVLTRHQWQAMNPASLFGVVHDGKYYGFHSDTDGNPVGAFVFDPDSASAGLKEIDVKATAAYSDPLTDALYLAVQDGGMTRVVQWDAGSQTMRATWRSKRYFISQRTSLSAYRIDAEYPPAPSRLSIAKAQAANLAGKRAMAAWNAQKQRLNQQIDEYTPTGVLPLAAVPGSWPITPDQEFAEIPVQPDSVRLTIYVDGESILQKNVSLPEPYRIPGARAGTNVEFEVSVTDAVLHRVELASSIDEMVAS